MSNTRPFVLALCSIVSITTLSAPASLAQTPTARSPERAAILAALRPRVERDLGRPVEFVVRTERVAGNVAFIAVMPQRPGGRPIIIEQTPFGRTNGTSEMDGVHVEGMLFKRGGRWQLEHYGLGSTDVWYSNEAYCARYRSVLPREVSRSVCSRPSR